MLKKYPRFFWGIFVFVWSLMRLGYYVPSIQLSQNTSHQVAETYKYAIDDKLACVYDNNLLY